MTLQAVSGADWNCFQGTGGFATLASGTPAGCTVTSGATQTWADGGTTGVGSQEFQFKSGTKFDDACVTINTGNNPPKDEWSNIAEYTEASTATNSDGGHDLYFYGASIRPVVNGNASGNVYFSQNNSGCHTVGDVLLAFNFLQGGGSPQLQSLRWISSGTCFVGSDHAPCWGDKQDITNSALFDGNINAQAIAAADNGISGTALPVNAFAEFGINLTQAIKAGGGGSLPCFANETWVSRSSGSSFTSNPEDVETVNRPTCGSITIIKHTLDGTGTRSGVDKNFGYTTPSGGLTPATFTLNDKDATDTVGGNPDPNNTQIYSNVQAGSYTVLEGAVAGFHLVSLGCTAQGSGSSGSQDGTTATQADITLGFGGSVTCTYTNRKNTATLGTLDHPSSTPIFPGTAVHDTATVTGSEASLTPTGTVTFYLCGPIATGSCDGTTNVGTNIGTGTLSGSGNTASADSPDVNAGTLAAPALAAGRYCFRATWPGDTNYPGALAEFGGANGTNECFTVTTITTTTTTTPSSNGFPLSANVNFGDQTIYDHAVVQAQLTGGGTPTGTVTFTLCSPSQMAAANGGLGESTCVTGGSQVGNAVTLGSDLGLSPPAAAADSAAFTNGGSGVNQTGTWCWRAVYSPGGANGSNYTGSSDTSNGECFTVVDTFSNNSNQTWRPNDTATVTAAHGAPLNGTLDVQLYTGDNCGATSGSAVSGQDYQKTLTNATSAADRTLTTTNTTFSVTTGSSVSWLVKFTSSDSNVTGTTHCEVSTLTITN